MSGLNKYDLEEPTATFGEAAIVLPRQLPTNTIITPGISQFARSPTSAGANCAEADDAESKKDFLHKVGICRKESRDTNHWLRILATAEPSRKTEWRVLRREAKALGLFFAAIIRKARQ